MPTYQEILDQFDETHGAARSASQPPEVIGWIDYDSVTDPGLQIDGGGGFIQKGNRWNDFIEGACNEEEARHYVPYYEALRCTILQRGLKQGGDWHQNDAGGVPVFNDGKVGMFSMRGWGDLMAAVWAEQENRDYSYMDFYMDSRIPGESNADPEHSTLKGQPPNRFFGLLSRLITAIRRFRAS